MASTLRDALNGLRGGGTEMPPAVATTTAVTMPAESNWSTQALQLLQAAERSLRNGDWAQYGTQLRQLRELLEQAARQKNPR
jgi:uncharacterized membrane protein (UPF0182 family)